MDVVIYKSLIIYIFVLFYVSTPVTAARPHINGITAVIGTDGIVLNCSFKLNVAVYAVNFFAKNDTGSFEGIAQSSILASETKLMPYGDYLFGSNNITISPLTKTSTSVTFNELKCKHERSYKCKLTIGEGGGDAPDSVANQIIVTVPPSMPDAISLVHTPADLSVITTNLMDYSSSPPSPTKVSNENETVSFSTTEKQNTTTAFNHSTIQTTGHNSTTATPSTISYRPTTETTYSKGFAEGDNITAVCTGNVGKPPAEHFFQKYRVGKSIPQNYTVTKTSISDMSDNCSYYRTSYLTFQVTAEDNQAIIRCVVNSSMAESDTLYVETASIEVYYEVRMPNIVKSPNKSNYVIGEDNNITLTCKSDGNPKPHYQWYQENRNESIGTKENFTIMDMNVTNSEEYTCKVSNFFNGYTFQHTTSVQINIMNKVYTTRIIPEHSSTLADILTTQSSSSGSSSGVDKKEKKSEGNLGLVVGIVVAVVTVIIVMVVIIACMRRKSKSPTSKNVSNSFDDSKTKPVTELRTGNYDYIALEDDAPKSKSSNNGLEVEDIKKHNEEYLKKQEEEEKKKNESNTPPQPAVYAQVNEATKSKNKPKTESTENNDKQEEDPYAETQENVYDKAGNSRHKKNENVEHFDSLSSSKQNRNGDNKQSIQTSQVGSFTNQGFEKDDNRKVATVSPTVRSSTGSQNDEETNSNRNSQSKKGYENIIGTDQTGISVEESSHRTAL